jgi:hypothetical protein
LSRALALLLAAAVGSSVGCSSDVFHLPVRSGDLSTADLARATDGALSVDGGPTDLAPVEASTPDDATLDAPSSLPLACAQLGCSPGLSEGDVDLSSGSVSGCHAYGTLRISALVLADRTADGSLGFSACADHIVIDGALSADGKGEAEGKGAGAGGSCGGGGGHGGAGGSPLTGCSGGGTYGDPNLPRTFGSGGGALGGEGGPGGGAIELAAGSIDVIGFISANGVSGLGASAGGGAGGSILIRADAINGAGSVSARGGSGSGLGGGGGGGRVAVLGGPASTGTLRVDVSGGDSQGGGSGGVGSRVQTP